MVHGPEGSLKSIISFRTQQLPILHALEESAVMEPFANWITAKFSDTSLDFLSDMGWQLSSKELFCNTPRRALQISSSDVVLRVCLSTIS